MLKVNKEKGITLIALVVTIIVLLILAGISIAMLTGENGILTNAQIAKEENSHGSVKDGIGLAYSEYQAETMIKNQQTENIEIDFTKFLKEKGYIEQDDSGNIVTKKMLGNSTYLGNGNESKDVYKIEKTDESYVVHYYDKDEKVKEIWKVQTSKKEEICECLITFRQKGNDKDPFDEDFKLTFREGETWVYEFEKDYPSNRLINYLRERGGYSYASDSGMAGNYTSSRILGIMLQWRTC